MHELFRGLKKGGFACFAVDPPWHHATWSSKGRGRSPKYRTMTLDEIAALPVGDYAAKDAFMHLWITGPFLAAGAHVGIMKAWGFKLSSIAYVWVKPTKAMYEQGQLFAGFLDDNSFRIGNGKTTRQNCEYVVLGRRGEPRRLSAAVRQVIVEPIRAHSQKPEKFYRAVERFCAGPRLDVFCGQKRSGWTCVGDQAHLAGRA